MILRHFKKRGKTRDSRAKMPPQTKAIAYGSRVPRKNASAPSVRADFARLMSGCFGF